MLHNPVEELGIDMFRKRVTGIGCLNTGKGLDIRLCGCLQLSVAQPLRHVLIGHSYQPAERHQVPIVGLRGEKQTYSQPGEPNRTSALFLKLGFKMYRGLSSQ